MRSYQHLRTGSHQNSDVKRAWARVVLGWVTSWEVLVLHPFLSRLFLLFVSLLIKFLVESNNLILALYCLFFVLPNLREYKSWRGPLDRHEKRAGGKVKFRDENRSSEDVIYVGCDHSALKHRIPSELRS